MKAVEGSGDAESMPGEFLDDITVGSDCRPRCGNFIAFIAMLLLAEAGSQSLKGAAIVEESGAR